MSISKNIPLMKAETQLHIEQDAVQAGVYWERGKGCFIGCLVHSNKASAVTEKFGMPKPLVCIAEGIFERLSEISKQKGIEFFKAIPDAIGVDGKDLSVVHWRFLKDILEHLPNVNHEVENAIDLVIQGMQLLIEGKEWRSARAAYDAARAAYYPATYAATYAARAATYAARAATYAARAATYAAYYPATYAATYAADAAVDAAANAVDSYDAEIHRQADVFLKLLRDAPVINQKEST